MLFESLVELPDDLAEGFQTMKLALMHHLHDGWRQISADDARKALDVLKGMLPPGGDVQPLANVERQSIERALAVYAWHRGNASHALGISVRTLQRKIRRFGLVPPEQQC